MTPAQKPVRARGRRVRFQLDDDNDDDNNFQQDGASAEKRSISGLLRLEDSKDTWF